MTAMAKENSKVNTDYTIVELQRIFACADNAEVAFADSMRLFHPPTHAFFKLKRFFNSHLCAKYADNVQICDLLIFRNVY